MGAPKEITKIIDKSQRIANTDGVYGAIVIPSTKGEVNVPRLVTSDTQLLKYYTPNETVEVGMSNSYFNALKFLQNSNKLWVVRASNTPLYGGAVIKAFSSLNPSDGISVGLDDPATYSFSSNTITASAEITDFTCEADVNGSLNNKFIEFSSKSTDYYAWFNVGGLGVDPQISGKTGLEISLSLNDTNSAVATALDTIIGAVADFTTSTAVNVLTITNAVTGTIETKPTNGNTGWSVKPNITTIGTDAELVSEDLFLLYGKDEGTWNNNIEVKIYNYRSSPEIVSEEDSFIIEVYYNGSKVEEYLCSTLEDKKDGAGNSLYIVNKLEQSAYISVEMGVCSLLYPQEGTIALESGSNGGVVTTSNMITALNTLSNIDAYEIDIVMDGGFAVPAYQKAMITLCETRKDSNPLFSFPSANETNSSYLNSLYEYRAFDLNANTKWGTIWSSLVKIYDYFNDREIWISPVGHIAASMSKTALNYEPWYPILGFTRGVLDVLDVYHHYTQGEMDYLYDNQINPIRFVEGRGIVVWGQKTLQVKASAFDRLNVMCLVTYIIPPIQEALEEFIGELNTKAIRDNVSIIVNNYMRNIQSRAGVTDYTVICDTSNNTPTTIDNNELHIDLYIQPTKSIEYIYFNLTVTSTGVSVNVG